ncbi:MAG: hypothetical protein MUO72_16795 [Bacteroidales bacterium]|nr:hypothetical protein [Bacteroidales bacterium]
MKKICLIICILSGLMASALQQEKYPEAKITNGIISANLYLPNINNGYYRATRFDWSGNTNNLTYRGHSYYGQWFEKYEPTIHDVVMGPVEEFGPVGYTEAKAGERFIKIGVGALLKPDDTPYNNFKLYKIQNPGEWKIRKKPDQIQFVHILKDTEYSYEYKKIVHLIKGKPEMVLIHTLKNTGKRTIETSVYNHNFFMIDKQPTGPGYVINFPFDLTGKGQGIGEIARIEGKQITFLRELNKSERIYCGALLGFSNNINDYDIRVENNKTGAGVRITSDQPLSKLVFWASPTTVCPEPYIQLKVQPGQEFSWEIHYKYYTFNSQ